MSHIPEAAIASMSGSMRDHLFWVANASPSATPYPGRNIATMRALERLSHVGIPKYDTDDCHDHADAAEAQILHMRDAAREALALVEDT